jgi:hypothetical protein
MVLKVLVMGCKRTGSKDGAFQKYNDQGTYNGKVSVPKKNIKSEGFPRFSQSIQSYCQKADVPCHPIWSTKKKESNDAKG